MTETSEERHLRIQQIRAQAAHSFYLGLVQLAR
jgi:hypothetical protein